MPNPVTKKGTALFYRCGSFLMYAYYFPSVEAGKFYKCGEKTLMPLSITLHHAATDGWHLAQFIEKLQQEADSFEKYL